MAKSSDYIRLPYIKRIEVRNYSLFKKDWAYQIMPGLNLFIGANGLGKTTSTYLIIYAIVGAHGVRKNYFIQREHEEDKKDESPTIIVDFSIGVKSFFVERYLEDDKIKELKIDNTTYDDEDYDNIEILYNDALIESTGIQNIEDIAFILNNFLIREEEGNYLLWDNLSQAKLLRLLINVSGFEKEYNDIAQKVQDYDTKLRGNQDIRYQFESRQKILKQNKDDILKKKSGFQSITETEKEVKKLEEELNSIKYKRQRSYDNYNYYNETLKSLEKEIEQISSDLEQISEEIIRIEKEFYTGIYSNEKVLSAIHKLKSYNICIYCNNKPEYNISNEIINTVEHENKCPVCHSLLIPVEQKNTLPKKTINLISNYTKDNTDLQTKLSSLLSTKETIIKDLDLSYGELNGFDKNINVKSIELYALKQKLVELQSNPEEMITEFDSEIVALQNQMEQYDNIIRDSRENYNLEKVKLIEINNQYNETINSFVSKLNVIFTKYTSDYFNENCVLVADEQIIKKSKVPLTTFIPEFDEKKRKTKEDCSTSERIFLEYLFRLSLIELYKNFTKNSAFLILETSEGAFDISNTNQLGNSLTLFNKNDIPFIIIANFSKPDFIEVLLSQYSNKNERVLNFLQFGRLSNQQEKSKGAFNLILDLLKLNRF